MCHAGNDCAFLHDEKNLYKGPAPRVVANGERKDSKVTPKPKVAAGAAVVCAQMAVASGQTTPEQATSPRAQTMCLTERVKEVMRSHARHSFGAITRLALTTAAMTISNSIPQFGRPLTQALPATTLPQTSCFDFEWVGDTGAGRNLSSLKHLPPEAQEFVGKSASPVSFITGGGTKDGVKSVGIASGLATGDELFLLKDCPNALSTGIQVQQHRKPFIWLPDQLPFFIKPDMVSSCVIEVPTWQQRLAPIG